MLDFKEKYGKWALVVGSSEGLGECFANECASRGLNVVICARTISRPDLEKVAKRIKEEYKVDVRIVEADISEENSGDEIVRQTDDLEIGFVIFNAAIEPGGPFIRIKPEDHQKAIIGNCITPTKVVWPLARKMAERKRGGIYLVTSIAAQGGIANWVSYGASKSYELILGEGLWYEMKQYGVDAGAYVTVDSETTFGDVKDVKLSDLQNGITLIANLDGFDPENSLDDALSISEYAVPAIQWAVGENILTGFEDTTMRPQDNATRAQMAAILNKIAKLY